MKKYFFLFLMLPAIVIGGCDNNSIEEEVLDDILSIGGNTIELTCTDASVSDLPQTALDYINNNYQGFTIDGVEMCTGSNSLADLRETACDNRLPSERDAAAVRRDPLGPARRPHIRGAPSWPPCPATPLVLWGDDGCGR